MDARNILDLAWIIPVLPAAGALTMVFLLVESAVSLAHKAGESAFGIGLPLLIALGSLITGLILMLMARMALPAFFKRKAFAAV